MKKTKVSDVVEKILRHTAAGSRGFYFVDTVVSARLRFELVIGLDS